LEPGGQKNPLQYLLKQEWQEEFQLCECVRRRRRGRTDLGREGRGKRVTNSERAKGGRGAGNYSGGNEVNTPFERGNKGGNSNTLTPKGKKGRNFSGDSKEVKQKGRRVGCRSLIMEGVLQV